MQKKEVKYIKELINFYNSICYGECEPVVLHNSLEWGHLLHDGENITGLIDWEHNDYCINGWKDLSDLYHNFVIQWGVEYSSGFIGFWNLIVEKYFCPYLKRTLNGDEIKLIQSLGMMQKLRKTSAKIYKNRLLESNGKNNERIKNKTKVLEEELFDSCNRLLKQNFI